MQNTHLRRISSLCAARSFAYLSDMSALAVLLRLELHPHPGILQRSLALYSGLNWEEDKQNVPPIRADSVAAWPGLTKSFSLSQVEAGQRLLFKFKPPLYFFRQAFVRYILQHPFKSKRPIGQTGAVAQAAAGTIETAGGVGFTVVESISDAAAGG